MFEQLRDATVYLIPLQLILAMLGMGATLSVRDFVEVFRLPTSLLIGCALQWVVAPAAGQLYIQLAGWSGGWAVGLVLLTVQPGGAMSNLLTFIARGRTALSISVTIFTTTACLVTVPLLLRLLAAPYMPPDFAFPARRIVIEISSYLVAPVITGMIVHRVVPRHAKAVSDWSVRASVTLVAIITLAMLGSGQIRIAQYGWGPPLGLIAFGALLSVITAELCHALGRYDEDTTALVIEVVLRNTAIGLLLTRYFFEGEPAKGEMLYVLLFYAGISLVLTLPTVGAHRYGKRLLPWHRRKPAPQRTPGERAS